MELGILLYGKNTENRRILTSRPYIDKPFRHPPIRHDIQQYSEYYSSTPVSYASHEQQSKQEKVHLSSALWCTVTVLSSSAAIQNCISED
jgi:hypothetical protein